MLATQLSQHTREKRQDSEEYEPEEEQNEQEEDEEVDMDNCMTVRRVYYGVAGSDDLLICFMHWGCALLLCSC